MPRIADYSVITDNVKTFTEGTNEEWTFGINNDAHVGSHGIFVCRLHITGPLQNFDIRFYINGREIFKLPMENKDRDVFTVHEIINSNYLRKGTNSFNVVVEDNSSSSGRVAFSDAYVMFQRDI